MEKIKEDTLRSIMLEILSMERKNLRSRSKTDQRMSEEIQAAIVQYSKLRK